MNKIGSTLLVLTLAIVSLVLCSCSDSNNGAKREEVFVSIPPMAYIVKSIVGDKVKVCTMIPEGRSPHDYSPAPRQVALLQNCKVYLTIGMPFEKQVIEPLFKDHPNRLVDISKGIKRREIDQEHSHSHHVHTEDCKHEEDDKGKENLDPHIWLSPVNDIILTRNATAELCRLYPDYAADFKANGQKLEKRFEVLQKGLQKLLATRKGEVFYVYHPAFGYFADAFINMLALLGWNPGTEQELFSLEELIEAFDLKQVHKSGAKFNPEKTIWFQQQYMQQKSDAELTDLYVPILKKRGIIIASISTTLNTDSVEKSYVQKVISLIKERAVFVKDLWDLSHYFFVAPNYDETVIKKWKGKTEILYNLIPVIKSIEDFSSANIEKEIKEWITSKEIGFGKVMQPLRLSLVGKLAGPHLFDIIELIGKQETIKRVENSIEKI